MDLKATKTSDSTNQHVASKSGLTTAIVVFLTSPVLQVRLFACHCISAFSRAGPLEAIFQASPLQALNLMLDSPLPQERAASCRAICSLARERTLNLAISFILWGMGGVGDLIRDCSWKWAGHRRARICAKAVGNGNGMPIHSLASSFGP